MAVGSYVIRFDGLEIYEQENAQVIGADLTIFENGAPIATLRPEKAYYPASDQMTTEVAVRTTAREDLYTILAGWGEDGSATLKIVINPLVVWLWIGFGVFIVGTLIAMLPDARETRLAERRRAIAQHAYLDAPSHNMPSTPQI